MNPVKKFSQFGIKSDTTSYVGDKIKLTKILNKEIVVHEYKIEPSKVKAGTECLHIQISMDGTKHLLFTGSVALMSLIKKVQPDDFPFATTIIKNESDRLEFT